MDRDGRLYGHHQAEVPLLRPANGVLAGGASGLRALFPLEALAAAGLPSSPALAFMAAACLSALFSKNIQYSILGSNRCDGLVTLLLYGGIALGVSRWGEFKERYVNLSALAAGLCAVVCILQLCRVNVLGLFPEGLDFYDAGTRYTGEFLGTMGNTNVLAAWFCLVIPR